MGGHARHRGCRRAGSRVRWRSVDGVRRPDGRRVYQRARDQRHNATVGRIVDRGRVLLRRRDRHRISDVGFALLSYCPGTGAAALGQGNFDALAGILGLMAGSNLYAQSSGLLGRTVLKWGDRVRLMLPELVRVSLATIVLIFASLLVVALVVLDQVTIR